MRASMAGEYAKARELVAAAIMSAIEHPGMDADVMGRAIIQVVVEHYCKYRSNADISQELEYIVSCLDDDAPVITRGC